MRVGYRWLQDYITIPWEPDELAERLTSLGVAVERIEPVFPRASGVVVARVESVAPHPQRPDLKVLSVNDGKTRHTVIAGARNCRKGLVTPFARLGAIIDSLGETPLTPRTFDGVESTGMCCSERDLGLSDDHSGLMELDGEQVTVGNALWESLELDEVALSFELTPNRSDCLSVFGIAREIGAIIGEKPRRVEFELAEGEQSVDGLLHVEIADADGCLRYAGRVLNGGRIAPSPFWLKRRLKSAGVRSINNAVDVTNFVMLETGQPLHAFDRAKIASARIVVRQSRPGEEFTTLDEQVHKLPGDAVMITDGEHSVAIGGVMGGRDSEVTESTTDFLIESACFKPSRIRRTRLRLGLSTESALRFEKGVDPNGAIHALDRAAALLADLTGAQPARGVVDNYPTTIAPLKLELDPVRVNRLLGTDISTPTMIDYLSRLECDVTTGKPLLVGVPTFRPDLTRPVDLTEEIARLHGYDKMPANRQAAGVLPTHRNRWRIAENRIRDILEGMGFCEMVGNSLTDPSHSQGFAGTPVSLRNPLSTDLSIMRLDLHQTLLPVIAHNLNHRADSMALYEVGRSYQADVDGAFAERRELIIALCGQTPGAWPDIPRRYEFSDLKGAVTALLDALKLHGTVIAAAGAPYGEGESFAVEIKSAAVGRLGRVAPSVTRQHDVKEEVWSAVFDLELICTALGAAHQFEPLPRYPDVYRDLAVVVDTHVAAGALQQTICDSGGGLIADVRVFDRYTGSQIPQDKVSVAFSLVYRHADRTLTDAEVDSAHARIVAALHTQHGAELRT
ncbi:MAG TPA: phenylalanine--tRNA ligase subunit beta [candidate division Zixibacteria bacterium]|jgi:phenylalanyl-tRNA synthetase beta chain